MHPSPFGPWPRYRGWSCFIGYGTATAAVVAAAGVRVAEIPNAGIAGRLLEPGYPMALLILSLTGALYSFGQLTAARYDRIWLAPGGEARRRARRLLALILARPEWLYSAPYDREMREHRLRHHIDYGVAISLIPLQTLRATLPFLALAGLALGLGQAAEQFLAPVQDKAASTAIRAGALLAFDSALVGFVGRAFVDLALAWITQATTPLAKLRRELDEPRAARFTPGANAWMTLP